MIKIQSLYKYYNNQIILNNINFHIKKGEIVGILGPNGAGKTTLIETIEGIRKIDSGDIYVLGQDIKKDYKKVQKYLGIQLQRNSLLEDLSVLETVELFRILYASDKSVQQLIDKLQLTECINTLVRHLSGGQFQRLKLCLAILNDPVIIFLDEPSTGLDPKARALIWELIKDLAQKEVTIILTTHYMEEAEYLCNRIIIVDSGTIVIEGSPTELVENLFLDHVVTVDYDEKIIKLDIFKHLNSKVEKKHIYIYTNDLTKMLSEFLSEAAKHNISIKNIRINHATLEDVFFHLTKKQLKNEENYSII